MKRITRDRRLTPEEAATNEAIRRQVDEELPALISRHHERPAALDQLSERLLQLKATQEAKGLSFADLTELTDMDRSALSKLESGTRQWKPSFVTPRPYASAWWFHYSGLSTNCTRGG